MKRPWPEEDDFFYMGVALAVFLTFCICLLISLEGV